MERPSSRPLLRALGDDFGIMRANKSTSKLSIERCVACLYPRVPTVW